MRDSIGFKVKDASKLLSLQPSSPVSTKYSKDPKYFKFCIKLVLGGEDDASTPIKDQEDIVVALRAETVIFHRNENCGRVPQNDMAI